MRITCSDSISPGERNDNASYTVTASALNLRQGPATSFQVVRVLKKGHAVQILGRIGDWAAVYDPVNKLVGAVDSKYLTASTSEGSGDSTAASTVPSDVSADEQAPARSCKIKQGSKPVSGL